MTAPSLTTRLTKPILTLIFSFVDSPSELAVTCSTFNLISHNDLLRASWLRNHADILAAWAQQVISTRSQGGDRCVATFPGRIITEPVLALAFDSLSSTIGTPASDILFKTLWSLAAQRKYSDVMYGVLAEGYLSRPPSLPRPNSIRQPATQDRPPIASASISSPFLQSFDNIAWRDALMVAVKTSTESPRFIDALLLRFLDSINPFIPEATLLAASNGKLRPISLFSETVAGGKVIQERGLEMLRAAASNGHRDVVLYLVGRGGFSEHHDALVRTYRGLHILLEASEKGVLDSAFSSVMEGWKNTTNNGTSNEEDQLQMRWRMACEMACERNYLELVKKLLDARTPKQLQDGELKIKLRMIALAIQNGHNELGNTLLQIAAKEEADANSATIESGMSNMLAGLGSLATENERNGLLLRRYCHIPDHNLAPQIGLTVTDTHNDWKQNVGYHRATIIRFLCNSNTSFLGSLDKSQLKDDLWSAFKLGHFEAAKYLKDATGIQVEWMDTASSWSLVEVANNDLTVNASDSIPPALAMALFETLGGSWCVGVGDSRGAVVTSKDIGALLVAAEASKDSSLARLKVSDYDAASRQISRDISFLTQLHPRMIINPEDKLWTKFLDGKLEAADKGEGLSWMEPKQEETAAQDDSAEQVNNPVTLWRDEMGLKEERENEELSFYLGLGGRLPETSAQTAEEKKAESELARQFHAEY
ncbi:hypothetical protein BDR26DRAFT_1009286 [Obelidium mucronatum]|nr:hypothetical protein BDR26DRAFT_1009286 [Obelidium mucronatum]